jgi:DNA-binding response OmpR family regulator
MLEDPAAKHIILAIVPPGEDRTTLNKILSQANWQLIFSDTFAETQTALRTLSVAVVLSEVRLSDGHSWKDVLQELDAARSRTPLIVADRLADEVLWAEVLNLGGHDVLAKPFNPGELLYAVAAAGRFRENELKRTAVIRKPAASAAVSARTQRAAVGCG